ncbi:MAG: ral secretion pathway protein [Verrucomicrobiota bacterium]
MKIIPFIMLLAIFTFRPSATAAEPPADIAAKADTNAPAVETVVTSDNGTNGLRLNFRGVSLDLVLNYLSEAAGFIINIKPGTSTRGKVDVWSSQTLSREEALNLLDTVLNQNGLAAIRNGRTLTIVNRDEAKTHDIPVRLESDPKKIPRTDEIVTQIIPVRFVEVAQLIKDLQPLVSTQTTMTANEAGNAIVITDTQANIRRVAEIIQDIDMGAEAVTQVRVFRLTNADPNETADLLSNLFPDDSKAGGGGQSPIFGAFASRFASRFGGGPPGGGGGGGGGGAGGAGDANQRIKKRARVIAVADQRTSSVVVSAAKELMEQIEGVIEDLDKDHRSRQTVRIYQLQNADPQEAQQVLSDIFGKNNTQNNRNNANQNDPLVNRSTTQNQQNNSATRSTTGSSGSRGVTGGTSFSP